jgi:hypothetical protein
MCQVLYGDHGAPLGCVLRLESGSSTYGLQSCVVRHQPFPRCRHAGVITARILLDGELQRWRHMAKSQS